MPRIDADEKLIAIFGRWPSFHDAEVLSLSFERTRKGFDVVAVIHVFEATAEVDQRGRYKFVKHTLVTLRCHDCEEVQLEGFNGQNVLSSLSIEQDPERADRRYTVALGGCYGLEGLLRCQRVEVTDAVPWVPMDSVYQTEPNQSSEPTSMSVTPPAAQEPRQP